MSCLLWGPVDPPHSWDQSPFCDIKQMPHSASLHCTVRGLFSHSEVMSLWKKNSHYAEISIKFHNIRAPARSLLLKQADTHIAGHVYSLPAGEEREFKQRRCEVRKIFAVWSFYPQNNPQYLLYISQQWNRACWSDWLFDKQHLTRCNRHLHFESDQCLAVSFRVAAFILDASIQTGPCI